jgi:hypothetical protein
LHEKVITEAFAAVRAAIASGNSEQLESAERALRKSLGAAEVGQMLSPATLRSLDTLQALLLSATAFYGGLIAIMKIQLQGYANSAFSSQLQSGHHFTVEG